MTLINIADLRNPDDPEGRTYRQCNAALQHQIPIGSLVELDTGVRLFVVSHNRDCDQTPLYGLSAREDDIGRTYEECGSMSPNLFPFHWEHGYSEESLTVIARR